MTTDSHPDHPEAPRHWGLLVLLSSVVLGLDLASKAWASSTIALGRAAEPLVLIPGHLAFIHVQNRGGAWSLLQGQDELVRRPFFLITSVVASVLMVSFYGRLEGRQRTARWGLALALGGALGNLADRIRFGSVVDFIDAYALVAGRELHWPTFNVADVAIGLGVALLGLSLLRPRAPSRAATSANAAPPTPPASGPPVTDRAPQRPVSMGGSRLELTA